MLTDAVKAKEEAEALVEEHKASMAGIEQEKAAAVAEAKKRAQSEGTRIVEEAKSRADCGGEQGGAVSGRGGVEGVLKNACGMGAAADDHALAGLNVGEQDVDVLHVLTHQRLWQIVLQQFPGGIQIGAGQEIALSHAEAGVAAHENLEMSDDHFLGALAVQPFDGL